MLLEVEITNVSVFSNDKFYGWSWEWITEFGLRRKIIGEEEIKELRSQNMGEMTYMDVWHGLWQKYDELEGWNLVLKDTNKNVNISVIYWIIVHTLCKARDSRKYKEI